MFEDRIFTLQRAVALRHSYRKICKRLVMTNGVFDILHRGHVEYLMKAAALGRELWVALNSDESVRKIKGDKRPLVPWQDRAEILLGLRCVDAVIAFDEETPESLYQRILPDVLVKGADYAIDQIAGGAAVIAAGGSVELVELVPNRSTTNVVENILTRYGKG